MHGIIFVTWENFLTERFGHPFLQAYRTVIGETAATAPLTSQIYDDTALLIGVSAACQLTGISAPMILREYGRYFMLNSLTNHLCAYLLAQVQSGRELLIAMRGAHAQMGRTSNALAPPVFSYEALPDDPNGLALIYNSPRQLCAILSGAIAGAAERFGEQVKIVENSCMKQGDKVCRFEVSFQAGPYNYLQSQETLAMKRQHLIQRHLADIVLNALPQQNGITVIELQTILQKTQSNQRILRPSVMLEALRHLQFAGLVATMASRPGEDLMHRRYWRTPTN